MKYIKRVSKVKNDDTKGYIINSTNVVDKEKNTYSANVIDKFNTYSTEEQLIGKWMGKNHYRKIITFTPAGTIAPDTWTILFNYTFTDLELLTKSTVINTDSANSGEIKWLTVQYFKNDKAFKGLHTRNSTVTLPANSLLVVEYTKTTD
jgi:hypothetical protein